MKRRQTMLKVVVVLAAVVAAVQAKELQEVEERSLPSLTLPSLIRASVDLVQGRGKKDNGQGAMILGAMMIAMGLTALAALSGKAMAASLAALLLSAASLFRRGVDGAQAYELVAHHRSLPDSYQRHPQDRS